MSASESAAKAPTEDDDSMLARKLQVKEQLVSIFGFDAKAADQALEVVGPDVTEACNFILERGLGQDQGGSVFPIDNCPHLSLRFKMDDVLSKLPMLPHTVACSYHCKTAGKTSSGGGAKSDMESDGSCPLGENWFCLECGAIRCSRYINGHGLVHWEETKREDMVDGGSKIGHCVAVSLADLSVWCHECSSYIHHPSLGPLLQTLEQLKFPKQPTIELQMA